MRRAALALALLAVLTAATRAFQERGDAALRPTVILIGFDGWRWDYHTKAPAPNLRSLMARGVRAEGLIPSFPSKTFPNFYTIVTGLYPGHHGIVANTIKDPKTERRLSMSNRDEVGDPMWWGGEPIWVGVQRAMQAAASMFWVGSETPIHGMHPRFWKAYDEGVRGNERVDQVLAWLDLPVADRPTFITVYFEDPDTAGHDHGPDSPEVREAIMRTDAYLGRLLQGLDARGLEDRVNLVVVSDHGMAEVNNDRVVVLDDYISLDEVEVVDINPTLGLFPKPGREDAVYRALEKAHPRLRVYRRSQTPARWHYRDHPRIPPLVGVVDQGWQLLRRNTVVNILARRVIGDRGSHGYDPARSPAMRGLFVAAGPAFRRGVTVGPFENVHIYHALARMLGVAPASNDGNPAVARRLLVSESPRRP
jgi:predicted AlkP superfamily pyrophosphatase or phosphodiesterase